MTNKKSFFALMIVAIMGLGFHTVAMAKTTTVKCVVRSDRSQISVDGLAFSGAYYAIAYSGNNSVRSKLPNQVGTSDNLFQVEFDFDSDPANVAAGATHIPYNFISGDTVYGEIHRASDGFLISSLRAPCSVK